MKILPLDLLVLLAAEFRATGTRIVMANGCFDVLHPGHVKHLQAAKRLGDVLMVTVTRDEYVNKGPDRPLFPVRLRCEHLAALDCVNYVTVNTPNPGEAIRLVRPHIYTKGAEYRDKLTPGLMIEKDAIESVGGQLVFTDEPEFHSTEILRKLGG